MSTKRSRQLYVVKLIIGCCVYPINPFDLVYLSDGSGYYFPSQNRFVPSSGSFPRQQQTLNGFRSGNNGVGYSPAPGSYQEQLLFIANENNSNNNNKQQAAIAANSPYGTPFGASSQQFAVSSNSQLTSTPAPNHTATTPTSTATPTSNSNSNRN